jgi:hypothetical protein
MFNSEIKQMLVQVISSWQVIAVTVVLVIYLFLVKYVSKVHHRRSAPSLIPKSKRKSKEKAAASGGSAPAVVQEGDELGLEEE